MVLNRQNNLDGNAVTNVASFASIVLNTSTPTKILDENLERKQVTINNTSSSDIRILKMAVGDWISEYGDFLPKRSSAFLSTTSEDKYYGELCAIAIVGTPTIHVTEN
jgi:hypothetical protein